MLVARAVPITFGALRLAGLGALLALITSSLSSAAPATFTVNSTLDVVDASPGNGACATSGSVCTLRAAVQEANALGGSHVITLPAGTYTLSGAANETASASGDLNILTTIQINGAGQSTTIIDGNIVDRVFHVTAGGLTLTDVTVQKGKAQSPSYKGGCIYVNGVNLTLSRVTLKTCDAQLGGGGIFALGPLTLSVTDSTISGNSGSHGGGIHGDTVTVTVTGTSISQNASPDAQTNPFTRFGSGAGIYVTGLSTLTLVRDLVSENNSFEPSAGVSLNSVSGAAAVTATIVNTTISDNSSYTNNVGGGGIGINASTTLTVINSTIASNRDGSAAVNAGGGQVLIKNSIVANSINAVSCGASSGGVITDQGNNLEYPGTTCGFSLGTDVRADPLLGALTANGGLTRTRALGNGSPAINAGNDTACAASPVSGRDQRGRTRPSGAHCDIGAYEVSASAAFTDPTLTAGTTGVKTVHITELRSRIDAIRVARNLSAFSWTTPTVTAGTATIQAVHITELREALRQAYVAAGLTAPMYTDPSLGVGTAVKAVHIAELRAAVLGIE